MKTLIIWIFGAAIAIGSVTALWKYSHELFLGIIKEVVGFVLSSIVLYLGWTWLWRQTPSKDSTTSMYIKEYIKSTNAPSKDKDIPSRKNTQGSNYPDSSDSIYQGRP